MKAADARTARTIDAAAMERYGIPGLRLMENAGRGAAEAILKELEAPGPVAVFTGKGNNGGDGYVIARLLKGSGVEAAVYSLCKGSELDGDAAVNARAWRGLGGSVRELLTEDAVQGALPELANAAMVVDAIFGTGLKSAVPPLHAAAIAAINRLGKRTVAIDMPSGIDATTGAVLGAAVKADLTLTMALPKLGLLTYPGREYAGRVEVIDIGVPKELVEDPSIRWNLLADADIRRILKPRKADSHKSTHGHLLVIAGSTGMTGAAFMAATAAMRAGAGLATLAVPESLNPIIEVKTTEVMSVPLPETGGRVRTLSAASYDAAREALRGKSSLVVGPGLSNSADIAALIGLLLNDIRAPLVLDADALNAFAPRIGELRGLPAGVVLTPHPGEMARLLGTTTAEVQSGRISAAERLVEKTGAVVVLKGAGTVIADPSGGIYINPTGNPGLATAGTGDVLAGMLGGLLAQGYPALEAASAAAYIHGMAGDRVRAAQGELGMMATDLLPEIPRLINGFNGTRG